MGMFSQSSCGSLRVRVFEEAFMIRKVTSKSCDIGSQCSGRELALAYRSRSAGSQCLVVNPEQRRGGYSHGGHRPPDASGLMGLFSEMMDKHAAKLAANQRANADGEKGESHVGALLSGRR